MYPVSNDFLEAITAPARQVRVKLDMYVFGTDAPPIELDGSEIMFFSLLEEVRNLDELLDGVCPSNEIEIQLNNETRKWTPTNRRSPYYTWIKQGIAVDAYMGVVLESEEEEYVPLGRFIVDRWEAPTHLEYATVVAKDFFFRDLDKRVPQIRAQNNTDIRELLGLLVESLGYDSETFLEFDDEEIRPILYGWVPGDTVLEAIQNLAVANGTSIGASRHGTLTSKTYARLGDPIYSMSEDSDLFTSRRDRDRRDQYSSVRIRYWEPYIEHDQEIIRIESVELVSGTNVIRDIEFEGPVAEITEVVLLETANSTVTEITYGSSMITLTIENSGVDETLDILIIGNLIKGHTASAVVEDAEVLEEIGAQERVVESSLVQARHYANEYAQNLLPLLSAPAKEVQASVRGNPALELFDIVQISDRRGVGGRIRMFLTFMDLRFDGGLESEIRGILLEVMDDSMTTSTSTRSTIVLTTLTTVSENVSQTSTRSIIDLGVVTALSGISQTSTRSTIDLEVIIVLSGISQTSTRSIITLTIAITVLTSISQTSTRSTIDLGVVTALSGISQTSTRSTTAIEILEGGE